VGPLTPSLVNVDVACIQRSCFHMPDRSTAASQARSNCLCNELGEILVAHRSLSLAEALGFVPGGLVAALSLQSPSAPRHDEVNEHYSDEERSQRRYQRPF